MSWERVNYPKWPQLIITLRLCLPQPACLCTPPPTTTSPKTSAATLTFQDQLQNCQGGQLAFIAIHHLLEPGSHTGWRCACRWPRWPPWRAPWTCTPTTTTCRRPGTPGRGGLPRLAGTLISIYFFWRFGILRVHSAPPAVDRISSTEYPTSPPPSYEEVSLFLLMIVIVPWTIQCCFQIHIHNECRCWNSQGDLHPHMMPR